MINKYFVTKLELIYSLEMGENLIILKKKENLNFKLYKIKF